MQHATQQMDPPPERDSRQDAATGQPRDAGRQLIRRAPSGYLWNQAFSLWLFVSLLIFQVIVTRSLSPSDVGVYGLVSTAANLGFYLASLGLSSAGTVYLPRALAEGGPAQAMAVAWRLVVTRLATVLVVSLAFLWALPWLARLLALTRLPATEGLARTLSDSVLTQHRLAIAGYIVCVGMSNLLGALLVALLRTRTVFVVGGLGQLLLVMLALAFARTVWSGVDGALAAQALPSALMALVYAVALVRALNARPSAGGRRIMGPVLQLGVASWLADLPGTSMVKPMAIGQLALVATNTQLAYFDRSYQMGDAAAVLFVEGLAGVSMAVMSAAYVRRHLAPLATSWRTVSKLQVLLGAPLAAFCVPHAAAIMEVLYGRNYAVAGEFLALFLVLNGVVQLLGGGAHQWALYVLGRQRWVVISSWGALGALALSGLLLVPRFQIAGALLAVGIARIAAQIFLLLVARGCIKRPYPVGFVVRILLALVIPVAFSVIWRPTSLWALVLSGAVYLGLLVLCLRLMRPLDAEDRALIAQVAKPLRALLLPFAAPEKPGAAQPEATGRLRPSSQPLAITTATSGPVSVPPPAEPQTNPPHGGQ
jgi:O-antigen/teichoic acid export membrane protein